jgi:hypothetical protein
VFIKISTWPHIWLGLLSSQGLVPECQWFNFTLGISWNNTILALIFVLSFPC